MVWDFRMVPMHLTAGFLTMGRALFFVWIVPRCDGCATRRFPTDERFAKVWHASESYSTYLMRLHDVSGLVSLT